jgi:hypothetical protein
MGGHPPLSTPWVDGFNSSAPPLFKKKKKKKKYRIIIEQNSN